MMLRIALFGLVSVTLLALGHVYVYRRLVRDVTPHQGLRRVGAWALGGLAVAVGLERPLTRLWPDVGARPLVLALTIWGGVLLYLLFFLLVVDGVRWVRGRMARAAAVPVSPARREVLAGGLTAASALAAGGTAALGVYRALTPPEVTEVPVRLQGLPAALEGFTLVQLSDIHVGAVIQERFLDMLVDTANRARPDLVAITGDLVDGSVARLGRYVARLQGLQSRYGTWFVTGNHDYYSGDREWVAALQGFGWQVLRNRHVRIGDAGASFDLVGVDDWGAFRMGDSDYDLDRALRGRDPSRASVLLAHQPQNLPEVARREVGIQLSGHTHGGQMFPGTLIGQLMWGAANTGLSRVGETQTQLYVSRGCGFVGPPMRVGAPPEVVKLVLLRA